MRQAIPSSRIRLIERTRLLRMLGEWRSLRLIRVTAPAGFGKTTLAAMWLQRLGDEPAVAWVTLDAEGDSPDALLRRIAASLLPAASPALPRVKTLCAAVQAASRECILVLDDCHRLRDAAALAVLQHLVDAAPPNLHLVLLSHETTPLNLGRLRLWGMVLDITAAEMSLDHEEFAAFVPGSAIEGLGAQDLAAVERRAEGWIGGLQMLAGEPMLDDEQQARRVDDFIAREVFASLSSAARAFLIDTALLPQLTPASAAAATGMDEVGAAHLLRVIGAAHLLITPLASPGPIAFHCHPLFREFLLRRLQEERTAEQQRALRLRAAAWLGAHGEVDAALTLLQPIGAWDEAAAIVAAVSRSAILRMDLSSLRRWLAQLPAEIVAGTPQLAVDAAWAEFLSDGADLHTAVTRARGALATARGPGSDEWRAELDVLAIYGELAVGAVAAARRALAHAVRSPHAAVGLCAGYLHLLRGHAFVDSLTPDQRVQSLARGERIFKSIGFPHGCIEAASSRSLIRRCEGNLTEALAGMQHVVALIRQFGGEHGTHGFASHFACGEMAYEMNRIAEARAALRAAACANQHGARTAAADGMVRLALALCDGADSSNAFVSTDAAAEPAVVAHLAWLRIRCDLRAGRPARCWRTVEDLRVLPADLRPEMPDLLWIAVLTGALADQRELPLLGRLLAELRGRLEREGNRWLSLRVRAMQVVHHLLVDDAAAAEAELHALLPRIEESGMLRVVLDWAPLEPLLAHSRSPFAQRLCGMFEQFAEKTPPFGLSAQEWQVLLHVMQNLSTDEIAQKLFVQASTVRKHLVNTFRKMGVHSREEAVHAARAAGAE